MNQKIKLISTLFGALVILSGALYLYPKGTEAQSAGTPRVNFFRSDTNQVNQGQSITLSFRCLNSPGGALIDNTEQNYHFISPRPVGRTPSTITTTTTPTETNEAGTIYTLTCLSSDVRIANRNLAVVVNPSRTPNFNFGVVGGQTEVDFNTPVTLTWQAISDVSACFASNNRPDYYNNWGSNGPLYAALAVPKSGERMITPNILFSTTFTLTCYNGTGLTRIQASRQVIVTLKQAGNFVFGGNNKIQAAVFTNGSIGVRGGNDTFTGSFVARSFNDLSNLVNIRFNYDYNLSRNWPPGFRYLNMPQPAAN